MAFPTASVIDSFNRADSALGGSSCSDGVNSWATERITGGAPAANVASNVLVPSGGTGDCYIGSADFGADTEVYVEVPTLPGVGNYVFLAARIQGEGTAAWDGYGLIWIRGTGWQIRRYDTGTSTVLGATVAGDIAAGESIGFEIIGDTLKGYQKSGGSWSEILSRTDATHVAAGRIGFELDAGTLENFGGGTVVDASSGFFRALLGVGQ